MLYSIVVVEIDLEQVLLTILSGDHGGVAPPLFSREGENTSGRHRHPLSGAKVPTDSLK